MKTPRGTKAPGEMGQMFLSAEYATTPLSIVKNQWTENESLPSSLSKREKTTGSSSLPLAVIRDQPNERAGN